MINQTLDEISKAPEPPLTAPEKPPFSIPAAQQMLQPAAGLVARAKLMTDVANGRPLTLLAAEYTTAHLVNLPKASARQRSAMLRFAVEEFIAEPLDAIVVSNGPPHPTAPTTQIALATSKSVLARHADVAGLFPEGLMVPPPDTIGAWNVWLEHNRAIVRASDGVGFATSLDLLDVIWKSVGRPQIFTLAQPLPAEYGAIDTSAAPPPPRAVDLAFRFADDHARETKGLMRTVTFAGVILLVASAVHLAVFAADTWALGQQAQTTRTQAQAAIEQPLPGVTITPDVDPILARLAPTADAPRRGTFLPLLADVSQIITVASVGADTPISFRRLAWGEQDNRLVVLVQAGGLDGLQKVQQELEQAGLTVSAGAASAGSAGAEVEMRILRGAPQ